MFGAEVETSTDAEETDTSTEVPELGETVSEYDVFCETTALTDELASTKIDADSPPWISMVEISAIFNLIRCSGILRIQRHLR